VKIAVRAFANLADYVPPSPQGDGVVIDLPEGTTVGELVRRLAIPDDLPRLLLVNGHEAELDRRLALGDIVSILPPLVGG
jgi:molybdopterin converting factor small subunit